MPKILGRRLYVPVALSLLLVAFLVTHEPLWLLGAAIWSTFAVTAKHSYRHFRRTYDLIEDLYPKPGGGRTRHWLLFISLGCVMILLFPGMLGLLSHEFVTDLYLRVAGLAFGLITILLAVQAIVPGITTWSQDQSGARKLRELRSILRASAGLEGFMRWFFFLFLLSVFGWFITVRFLSGLPFVVDLSSATAFTQFTTVFDLLNPFRAFHYDRQYTLISASTLLFAVFVYATAYGVAQLYYLFIAANTLVLPIRDSLLSHSVEIERIETSWPQDEQGECSAKVNDLVDGIKSSREFNGRNISLLRFVADPACPSRIAKVSVHFEMEFIELDEMLSLVEKGFASLFGLDEVDTVDLTVFRRTHGAMRRQDAFALQLNREEWRFLSTDIPGFPHRYKLDVLEARIIDFVLAESQIA